MKMNDTVARIVEIMFQDVDMNEETSAIRDEVMNNCQERYNDLVFSGMNEDDAIAAVVESLSGMEDVLRPYKRRKRHAPTVRVYEHGKLKLKVADGQIKTDEDDDFDEDEEDEDEDEDLDDFDDDEDADEDLDDFDEDEDDDLGGIDEDDEADEDPERYVTVPAAEIRKIDLHLTAEDVTLERSSDGDYHVLWNDEDTPNLTVSACDGELLIGHEEDEADEHARQMDQSAREAEKRIKDSVGEFVKTANGRLELDFSKLSGMLRSLNGTIKNAIRNGGYYTFGDGEVTIQVPEQAIPHTSLCTTSGDICIEQVAMADLSITTTSGNVEIDQREDQHMQTASINTTSGDVYDVTLYADEMTIRTTSGTVSDADLHADQVSIGTTSGDVEDVNIAAREVNVTTVSGDVEADIHADNASVRTTSGDAEVEGRMHTLNVNTISGDVELNGDVAELMFKTVSGDVDVNCKGDAIRSITGSTVSGDVEVDLPDCIGASAVTVTSRAGWCRVNPPTKAGGPTVSGRISTNSGNITIE